MVSQDLLLRATIGLIYESIIIILFVSILFLAFKKYQQKKHKLTLYLILVILNFTIAVIFSWISKLNVLTIGLEFSHVPGKAFVNEMDPLYWILLRITDFRVSFVFVTIAIYFSYVLKVNLFEEGYDQKQRIFVIGYSIFTAAFAFFMYQRENLILDTLAFFFIFFLMFLIYIPFFLRAYKAYRTVQDQVYKKGFLALALLSICYILVLFNFLIDRILIMLPGFELGFTLFYYLAWLFCAAAAILGYLGFIKPRTAV